MNQPLPTRPVDPTTALPRPRFVVRETAPAYLDSPAHLDSPAYLPPPAYLDVDSPADPGFPEAGTVHELLKTLQGIGNEVRLGFLDALRMLHDGNLCFELGYSSFHQYCDRELGLARSTSYEYIRVAEALDDLPRLRVLFGHGELSWEQVRAITRVAAADTEVPWIELAFDEPVQSLLAEVREAQRAGRDAPRDKRYGLPNLMVRLVIDLTLEDKERVRAAFERVAELAPVSNRVEIAAEEELGRDGMPPGAVDEPNSPRLARQVLHRDGLRCANPGCDRRRNLHAHHIVFRAQGGRTALSNEVAVCDVCHALLHKGLLEVTGSAHTGLTWQPRPVATGVKVRDAAALCARVRELGTILAAPVAPTVGRGRPEPGATRCSIADRLPGAAQSTAVDSPQRAAKSTPVDTPNRVRELAWGLMRLGFTRAESEHRVRAAIAAPAAVQPSETGRSRAPEHLDDAAILMQALRG